MLDNEPTAAPDSAVTEPTLEDVAAQVFGDDATLETAEPTAEAPKEAEPKPAVEKASSRIIAAKRAEIKAAQARAELASQREELERGKAELKELAQLASQMREAKVSPSKALELLGMSPKEFLESLATEHEPEAVAKRVMGQALSETEKLRLEIAEMRQAQQAREREQEGRVIEAQSTQAQQAFLDHVAASEAYPHTVEEFTPSEIVQRGWDLATKYSASYHAKFGVYPSDEVIAEELENQARQRAEERAAWRAKTAKSQPRPSGGIQSGEHRAAQPVQGPSKTLTSRASSERTSAPKAWSQEAADEESLRILTAALRNAG